MTVPFFVVQVMEDISSDYAKKTATLDPFPHASISAVGIHPCKHAETMKRLSDAYSSGSGKKLLVDQCACLCSGLTLSACTVSMTLAATSRTCWVLLAV